MSARMVIAGVLRRPSGSALTEPVNGRDERYGHPTQRPDAYVPSLAGLDGPRAPLGPLAVRPEGVSRAVAVQMLLAEVEDLPVDRADRSLLLRAEAHWDTADVVILASLLARARAGGPSVSETAPAGPAAGWAAVCSPCGARPVIGPVTLPEVEAAARAHDIAHHDGAWTVDAICVDAAGRPAASPLAGAR